MKRAPRYDPPDNDPLRLKPQLSSFADSVSFSSWCESSFRDKIVLGGHDLPNGDEQHNSVFGAPGNQDYDGLHFRGPAGRSFLTRSIAICKNLKRFKPLSLSNEPVAIVNL